MEKEKELSPEEYIKKNTMPGVVYDKSHGTITFSPDAVTVSDALEAVRLSRLEGEEKLREIREGLYKIATFEIHNYTYYEGLSRAIDVIDKHLNQK